MTINEHDVILLEIRKQMQTGMDEMQSTLNKQMFKTDPLIANLKIKSLPKWKKFYYRVSSYLYTLWLAIKGTELELPYED